MPMARRIVIYAVASLCSYVKRGIECWSNSGFLTPLTTSISAGDLIIMDSKLSQSPQKESTIPSGEIKKVWLMRPPI